MLTFADLMQQCAPQVSPVLMHALVRTESTWRPFAIGLDATQGSVKQPKTLEEAVATAKSLEATGRKFSVGLAQIHISNVARYGLTWEQAFDPCTNLSIAQKVLWSFFHNASARGYKGVSAVWAALRGYNSGAVDRGVSDDYANKIFAYMSSTPRTAHLAAISLQPAGPQPAADRSPGRLTEAVVQVHRRLPMSLSTQQTRSDESLELFEKNPDQGNF
jgi:type IV secretion system protein VirB1